MFFHYSLKKHDWGRKKRAEYVYGHVPSSSAEMKRGSVCVSLGVHVRALSVWDEGSQEASGQRLPSFTANMTNDANLLVTLTSGAIISILCVHIARVYACVCEASDCSRTPTDDSPFVQNWYIKDRTERRCIYWPLLFTPKSALQIMT